MPSRPLTPGVALGVTLSAICSRNRYTKDPAPVIAELRAEAGGKLEILTAEVGRWIGFYNSPETRVLVDALRAGFSDLDLQPHIELGQTRRDAPWHSTPGT